MESGAGSLDQQVDPRRAALDEVLRSHTFARSEQLRNFLRYVCEKELAGQGGDLKEYSIGVEVFRRGNDYSPASDSTVRSRAWELRHKLEEYYSAEMPSAPLRIVLPKGSYIPSFVELAKPADALELSTETTPPPPIAEPRRNPLPLLLSFAAGVLVCLAAVLIFRQPGPVRGAISPVLLEAWGPLAGAQANVLMCIASGLHMVVRAAPFNEDPRRPNYKAPPELADIFRQHRPLEPNAQLYMRPTDSVVSIGILSGTVIAGNTLRSLGSSFQVLPERAAPLPSFRGRNVILFGEPQNSNAAAQLLSRAPLVVAYDPEVKRMVIQRRPQQSSAPPVYTRKLRDGTGPATVYGLLTVLPGDGPIPSQRRIIVVSGISTVGVHGAMEYFSSPEKMSQLRDRFLKEGFPGFPPAYQVVVLCKSDDTLLLSADYAGHEVLQ